MKVSRLIGVAMLLAAVVFAAFALYLYNESSSYTEEAIATIVAYEESEHDRSVIFRPVFSYTDAQGHEWEAKSRAGSGKRPYRVGDEVAVVYDPADPARAEINAFQELWLAVLAVGGAAIVVCAFALVFIFIVPKRFRAALEDTDTTSGWDSSADGSSEHVPRSSNLDSSLEAQGATTMNAWGKAHLILCIFGFVGGVLSVFLRPTDPLGDLSVVYRVVIGVLPLFFFPVALPFIIGLQVINPLSDRKWTVPDGRSNFLPFGNPLHFFHTAAYSAVCTGAGMILASPARGFLHLTEGLGLVCGFFGIQLGLKLCVKLYPGKFTQA